MTGQKITHNYHLVRPSVWPIATSFALGLTLFGALIWMVGDITPLWGLKGSYIFIVGLVSLLLCSFGWWYDVVAESNNGENASLTIRVGLRYGMVLFILSEVMFFVGWFWAFINMAVFPDAFGGVALMSGGQAIIDADGNALAVGKTMLQNITGGTWPPVGREVLSAWEVPLLNTFILLMSGTTVTWAHHSLLEGNRKGLIWGLAITIVLGMIFTSFQALEYYEIIKNDIASFGNDVYGASFFMATGFHGAHVIIGTIFLAVCLFRALKGGLTKERHLGFECAAWYWHFVDVVWLFLFFLIYVLGNGGYLH